MSDAGGALPHSWCLVFGLVWASGRHAISGHWAFFFKITLFSPIFPPFPLVLAFFTHFSCFSRSRVGAIGDREASEWKGWVPFQEENAKRLRNCVIA